MSLELLTKCIHKPIESKDGYRISVMSRHTENDGITKDERIIPGTTFSLWMTNLAPPDKLVGDWYKRGLDWEIFKDRYLDFLQNPDQRSWVLKLIQMTYGENVTILCTEESPEQCHRRLLAEECARLDKDLNVYIK